MTLTAKQVAGFAIEDQLDQIFEAVDKALLAGQFAIVDLCLQSMNIAATSTDLLGGWLSITAAAAHRLPGRAKFYDDVERVFRERGEKDIERLLDGLK